MSKLQPLFDILLIVFIYLDINFDFEALNDTVFLLLFKSMGPFDKLNNRLFYEFNELYCLS